jgi:hypothetical protein
MLFDVTLLGKWGEMEELSSWFCANCLRMLDQLSRHGRCPYCDSDAVDVACRRKLPFSDRSVLLSQFRYNLGVIQKVA